MAEQEVAGSEGNKTEKPDVRQGLPETVKVEESSKPMQLTVDNTASTDGGPWVQYNGVGTVRVMGPAEWSAVGLKGEEASQYFEWNYLNKRRIPRSRFTDAQLQYLLRVDDRFSLVSE